MSIQCRSERSVDWCVERSVDVSAERSVDYSAERSANWRAERIVCRSERSRGTCSSVVARVQESAFLAIASLTLITASAHAQPVPALKEVFKGSFLVGSALAPRQFDETDTRAVALIKQQFNTITPENVLKWEQVHPQPGVYNFTPSDHYVAFGERNGMFIVGHTLVWHSQVPRWVFEDSAGKPLTRDVLLARMKDHIQHVMGRYKGRIKGWDVVNEALNEDGTMRQSPWFKIIGDDFVVKAFQLAHEVDPGAELYYNDYNLANPAKRDGAIALVKRIRAAGIPVAAIGTQEHHKMDWPSPALVDSMFNAFRAAGIHTAVTELDVDVLPRATQNNTADVALRAQMEERLNPYKDGLPDSVQQALATRYGDLFAVYVKHRDIIDRITFWGVGDGDSWLNGWPVRGRTNYPLLFDRQGKPKPVFDKVIRAAPARTIGNE